MSFGRNAKNNRNRQGSAMKKILKFAMLFRNAAIGFIRDNAFKLSASLSYYTVFALCPLLIIIISLAGFFYGKQAAQGELYLQINALVGTQVALQIQDIIKNIQHSHSTTIGAIVGAIILVIAATGVFTEMQDSINYIWSVKAKPKKNWHKFLFNRLLSFSLVIGMGFLLLVSLIMNWLIDLLSDRLVKLFAHDTVYFFQVVNSVIMLVVISGLFTVIFKILPDAKISWRDSIIGSSITAVLFLLGKYLISYYIGRSNLGLTYGTAASIIIILAWVYYSAVILFYGAEFTKMYALQHGAGIRPKETAVFIIKKETMEVPPSYLDT
jgi:membrane protein